MMAELPTGTVTFLFTDIEGSSALWEREPVAMQGATARHDALIEQAVAEHGGVVVRPRGEGDSRFAVFARASDAVAAALAMQRALTTEPWPTSTPLRVRVALHTGEAELREGDYYGSAVNRCARLRAVAHGGQVLVSQATVDLAQDALPVGAGLRALGEHRLRDLTRPEPVHQLLHPDLPADFPPLRSLDSVPHNLPIQLTSFVGRERELAEIVTLLAAHRLVTLTGAGGCGKTRLALQAAADAQETFPDGVWLVELAPLSDPDLVPQAVAQALGVIDQPGQPLLTTLVNALRSRHLLLVLDNCEHLLDVSATLVETLLRGCPDLRVLATSRELLGASGEIAWRVPSLATPAPEVSTVDQLRSTAAVQLLVERAGLVQPGFALTDANAAAVAQVCRRLDGMPLAIELAAARLTALSPAQIATRLDDRFRLLTGGRRTAVRRQQTLQAAIDWSHDLLSAEERMLLRRLAVFAGGWTLEAAEAVCGGDGFEAWVVLDLLTRLVEKSLVVADEAMDEPRYRLLETVRQYASEKLLAAGEAEAVRDRHLAWAVALAEQAEPALRSADQIAWMERLEVEHDNIRTALDWARSRPDAEAALRLAASLWHFWEVRGYYREARSHYEAVLAMPKAETPTRMRALALCGLTFLMAHMADLQAAARLAEESIAISIPLGDYRLAALAQGVWTFVLALQSDYPAAHRHAAESARLADAVQDRWSRAFALRAAGLVALLEGDQHALRRSIEERLPIVRQIGNPWLEHSLYADMRQLAYDDGDYNAARTYGEQNLARARALRTPRSIASATLRLAAIALHQGDVTATRTHLSTALQLFRDLGNRWEMPWALDVSAGLAAVENRPQRALRLAGAAAGTRATLGMSARPQERRDLDQWLMPARAALTGPEQAAAWAEGEALTLDEALADALAGDGAAG
jgi:predicted ATPase/class 3 adenylate cyclase